MAFVDADSPDLDHALDRNWNNMIRTFGASPQTELYDDDELFWFITGVPEGSFNGVQWVNLRPATADQRIDETLATFARRNIPGGWLLGPVSAPHDIRARLEARGLHVIHRIPTMVADLHAPSGYDAPLPEDTLIVPVDDMDMLGQWIITETRGFEASPRIAAPLAAIRNALGVPDGTVMRRFLAWHDGESAATATLFMDSGVAGIYDVCTVPELRRRGLGSAITRAAMQVAIARGYTTAVLQATEDGFDMYQQLGFRTQNEYEVYAKPHQ